MTKDIEREAFEKAYQPDPQKSPFPYFLFNEEKNLYEAHSFDGREVSLINAAWWGWQAAKANEAEKLKGCVVVPVEMPDSFDDALYMYSNDISVVNSESDGFLPMADFDHGKVWQLVVEAARGGNE